MMPALGRAYGSSLAPPMPRREEYSQNKVRMAKIASMPPTNAKPPDIVSKNCQTDWGGEAYYRHYDHQISYRAHYLVLPVAGRNSGFGVTGSTS
jgi:hypothetical protein